MSTNPGFLAIVLFTLYLPGIQIGYAVAYQNQLTPCFEAKFQWDKGYDTSIHNSLLGSSVILGMTLGALSGGVMM